MRVMRRLRSLTARMVLGHILVATLTSVIGVLVLVLILARAIQTDLKAADYRGLAMYDGMKWLFGLPDGQPNDLPSPAGLPGFGLVLSSDDSVLFSQGDTPCRAGKKLADCAPELVDRPAGERFFQKDGQRWAEVVLYSISGQRVITHRGPPSGDLFLLLPGLPIYGTGPFMAVVAGAMAVLSVPMGLALAWLLSRPLARRLSRVAQASRSFAAGELHIRLKDRRVDEIGELSRQFDDMADALEQNVNVLRELAQRNAELAQRAEQVAIQAERVRLSRDLHDAIAQRLFSLSVSTATLPDLIKRDQDKGAEQAQAVATLAEQTLLDLRALLVELRPSSVVQRGLTEAMQALCTEWEVAHHIAVECSLMLTGNRLPAGVEDVLYRICQEALNNIAKHAGATSAHISVVEGRRQITLSVTDNGLGFAPEQATSHGKFGLISMRERASSLGGALEIESDTARGSTLRVTLPLEREKVAAS